MNWNQYSTSWGSSLQQWMMICLCDFIIFHLTFPFVTSLFSIDFFHHHYQLLLFQLLLHQSLTRKSSVSGRSKDDYPNWTQLCALWKSYCSKTMWSFQDGAIVSVGNKPMENRLNSKRLHTKAFISFDLQHLRTPQYICLLIYSIYISTIASRSFRQSIYRTIISHKSLETKYLRSRKSIYRIITVPFLLNYNSFFSLKLLQQLFS